MKEPDTTQAASAGYTFKVNPKLLRFGPRPTNSRKKRRHRIRQHRRKESADLDALEMSIELVPDRDTGMMMQVTRTRDKRTNKKDMRCNLIWGMAVSDSITTI